MLARITALTLALFTSVGALGQSTVLIQDSFRLVPRPHGDRGRIRDVFIHTGLQDFWTILPGVAGARWSAPADDPKWIFSASSIDALEWPEPEPGFNGTASGQAHSAALIPFTLPSSSVTAHVEVVQFYGFPDGLKLGFTASSVLSDNFASNSDLYLEFHGTGRWRVMTRRQPAPLLEGDITPSYRLGFGWVPMVLSFDPATRRVGGMINGEVFGPVTLGFDPVVTHVGFEAIADIVTYMTVNNFIVRTGGERLFTAEPVAWSGAPGQTAVFSAATDEPTASWQWRRDGQPLNDGPTATGSVVSGTATPSLTIGNTGPADSGVYDCLLITPAGIDLTSPVSLDAFLCPADYDANSFVNGDDFDRFVGDFEAGVPGADINADTFVTGDDFDFFMDRFFAGC